MFQPKQVRGEKRGEKKKKQRRKEKRREEKCFSISVLLEQGRQPPASTCDHGGCCWRPARLPRCSWWPCSRTCVVPPRPPHPGIRCPSFPSLVNVNHDLQCRHPKACLVSSLEEKQLSGSVRPASYCTFHLLTETMFFAPESPPPINGRQSSPPGPPRSP